LRASRGALGIEGPVESGLMARYRGDPEALRPLRQKQVTDERRGRRQQTLGRRIRSVLPPLVGAVDADQQLNLVVVGRDILVTDGPVEPLADRKSTRLNSSHSQISYAVFCLKK